MPRGGGEALVQAAAGCPVSQHVVAARGNLGQVPADLGQVPADGKLTEKMISIQPEQRPPAVDCVEEMTKMDDA